MNAVLAIVVIVLALVGLYLLPEIEVDDDGVENLDGRDLEQERANKPSRITHLKPRK